MRRRAVEVGLVVTAIAATLAGSTTAGAATRSAQSRIVLAPNHHVSAKPGGGGHGGGGGGGGTAFPGWASSNWSGYAVTSGTYTAASGQWQVPTVSATKSSTYSAAWVGVGGFTTADLIQTGTEQDFVNGHTEYAAWWTTSDLGYAEQVIDSITVRAGDIITASVTNNGDGTWTMALKDGSQAQFKKTVDFSSSETSAEWIMEAPGIGGRTAPLAHYGSDVFDPDLINVNGVHAGFKASDGGELIQKSSVVSIPSAPDSEQDGFAIAYGSTPPPAP